MRKKPEAGPTAIDCQGFAGGFTLGMARAGFDVIEKRENVGGFGVPIVDHNRDLINPDLNIEVGKPDTWRAVKADVVFGNPPCSGFSNLTRVRNMTGSTSGADHSINQCMWDFVAYAAACEAKIAIMESVQDAYKRGRDLMLALRFDMEERTGKRYDLVHVLHNNASVGGAAIRKRYFMVLARSGLRFGIDPPVIDSVPIVDDLFYDLETMALKPDAQRYRRKPKGAYAASLRSSSGLVDGHDVIHTRTTENIQWIAENAPEWRGGEFIGSAMRRVLDAHLTLPDRMRKEDGSIYASLLSTDPYKPRRWHSGKTGAVINGTGVQDSVHPTLPRPLTLREGARVLGYPDDWSLETIASAGRPSRVATNQKWLGKGISVPCGQWIGGWARRALAGQPGPWRGTRLGGEREWLIDVTNDHKAVYNERTGEAMDSRSKELVQAMGARLG